MEKQVNESGNSRKHYSRPTIRDCKDPAKYLPQLRGLRLVKDMLRRRNRITTRISGDSMYPALKKGDAVIVEKVDPSKIAVGDMILFERWDYVPLCVHRVIGKVSGGFITKGDKEGDERKVVVMSEKVLGKVIGKK